MLVVVVVYILTVRACLWCTEAVDEQEESVAAVAPAGKGVCKYQRKGQKGECDPETKKMVVTMQLKKKSPATCEPTKTVSKPCKEKGE